MDYLSFDEIFNQPEAWKRTFEAVVKEAPAAIDRIKAFNPGRIIISACGSSYWGALSGGRAIQKESGIHVDVITSGDLLLNYNELVKKDERILLITPSRSGMTSETVNAVRNLKGINDCMILNIGCAENALLNDLAHINILIPWVYEISICQTRSFTNLYIAQIILAACWSGNSGILSGMEKAIAAGSAFIGKCDRLVRDVAGNASWSNGFVLANSNLFGIGCEGALILQEMSQMHMDYYHTFEYRHGPIVLTDSGSLVVMMLTDKGFEYEKQFISEIKDKKASILVLGDISHSSECSEADYYIDVGNKGQNDYIKGIYYITVCQMLAYYKAIAKGKNPDQPADLVQWISLK